MFLVSSWLHHCLCHVSHSSGLKFFAASERQMMGCPAGLPGGGGGAGGGGEGGGLPGGGGVPLLTFLSRVRTPRMWRGGQCWYLGKPQVFGAVKRNHVEIRTPAKNGIIWVYGGGVGVRHLEKFPTNLVSFLCRRP